MKRILIECHDLSLKTGTGIATYARSLAIAARSLGWRTEALQSTDRLPRLSGTILDEVLLSDSGGGHRRTLSEKLRRNLRWLAGRPFGARPRRVVRTGIVVGGPDDKLSSFDELYVAEGLFAGAERHLAVHKKRLDVKFDQPPDLFHASRPVPLRVPGVPNLYTVHDLVPLRLPHTTLGNKAMFHAILSELARTADHFVTVSDSAKDDLVDLLKVDPARVTTTYQAVSFPQHLLDRSPDEESAELHDAFGLEPGEYFLFVGALEPKKNVQSLIEAYAASRSTRPLIITGGPGWLNDQVLATIQGERFLSYELIGRRVVPRRQVRRLSYVPQSGLVSLIRGARAMLFPSIYEGFGLPVVEAMLLGTPVMTSDVSSLPEVAGGAALLVDPYDLGAMTKAIRTLDADGDLRADLSRRGRERAAFFSPERYRERLGAVYGRFV